MIPKNAAVTENADKGTETPEEHLFADMRLHPNDNGFEYYYGNLSKRVKDLLQIL